MKREVQLKLVMIHFTKLQVTMRRELFLLNLSQRKNQATKMRRTMNQVWMTQSHSLLLQKMIHCLKSLNNFLMMLQILRKTLLKYKSQPNNSNLLSRLLPNQPKLLHHLRLLQPQLPQLNQLLQFQHQLLKLQLLLQLQQLKSPLLLKRMVPQLLHR